MPESKSVHSWKSSPHTADLAIEIESNDHAGLFHAAFEGLLGILEISLSALSESASITEHSLTEKFCSLEDGLVDFLNECIYLMDAEELIPYKIHWLALKADSLDAVLHCRDVSDEERSRVTHIKAATYSDLEIVRVGNLFRAKIILDT
jgi:SHS2 domain-containing protein